MIEILYNREFLKSAKKLPQIQQEKLSELITFLEENPYDPRLHTKHLSGLLSGLLSFRVTRDWRVIFQFIDNTTIQLIRVAHRKDVYR